MTLGEIEAALSDRNLRLRRAVRRDRRYVVEVADRTTGASFEATGIDIEQAIKNALEAAARRPVRRHRYTS